MALIATAAELLDDERQAVAVQKTIFALFTMFNLPLPEDLSEEDKELAERGKEMAVNIRKFITLKILREKPELAHVLFTEDIEEEQRLRAELKKRGILEGEGEPEHPAPDPDPSSKGKERDTF
jgi:hypothetical protein